VIDISVVLSTYRRPAELAEAAHSALNQPGARVELLVVDDCPESSARGVVHALNDDRVRYFRTPKPTGGRPSIVRNLAWPRARGRFVHFLDDDDIVPEGHYRAVKVAFAEHRDVGVVFGRIEPFGQPEPDVEYERRYFAAAARRARLCRRFGRRWGLAATMLFHETPLVCSAALIRRECIAPIAGFNPDLRVNEDVDFYARAIRRFGAAFIDRVVLHRRVGPSLIRQPEVERLFAETYTRMHAHYRDQWGMADFFALKSFARAVRMVM
jgi:glycosyltransferase involved in cell wall biosynthesis